MLVLKKLDVIQKEITRENNSKEETKEEIQKLTNEMSSLELKKK